MPFLGTVNLWLLKGDPLTLVDAGPANADGARPRSRQGLAGHGYTLADIEQLLLTHHHLDHAGLAHTISERSGARGRGPPWHGRWGAATTSGRAPSIIQTRR